MKIFVTGASGLVGRATIAAATREGHDVVALDVHESVRQLDVERAVHASVMDREAVIDAAAGCDAIVHTAAMHGSSRGKESNQAYLRANVIGAENVFEAARTHGVKRVVCASTYEVLCGYKWAANGVTVYDERTPARPDWIYPVSKLMVEELGRLHARKSGLEVVQLRYAWVRNVPIEKIGFGLLARSVHLDDVVSANLRACAAPNIRDEVLLVGPDSPLELADVMKARTDPWGVLETYWPGCSAVLKQHGLEPDFDQFWPAARLERTKQALGWRPRFTFERFLRTLGWQPAGQADSHTLAPARS